MDYIVNRSAEQGGEIISDTAERNYKAETAPICVRILADTVIETIESWNMTGIDYYQTLTLDVTTPLIMANITKLKLTSGAVQVIRG